jgi:methyl-accepting chemotaxis protein
MKVDAKLGFDFGVLIAMMIGVIILSVYSLEKIDESMNIMGIDGSSKAVIANDITDQVNLTARSIRNLLLLFNQADIQKEGEGVEGAGEIVTGNIEKLQK